MNQMKNIKHSLLLFLCLCIIVNSQVDWSLPIATGKTKFIGCTILHDHLSPNWDRYWNQVTPEYLGKWTSTQPNKDQMSWSGLDFAWNHAKLKNILFKGHTFVWGQQIPYWVGGLSTTEQAAQVQEWIKLYCQRYPDYQLIDVVNEPLHQTPNYINAIGGKGNTGWDWVIWSYQKARQYCPNAKLLINDYFILSDASNVQKYSEIINLLKARNLIDGVGCQSHQLEYVADSVIRTNLDTLAALGLPIYISQLDLDIGDDTAQLNRFKALIPLLYEHPAVKGITFWGYTRGEHWLGGAWMYDANAAGGGSSSSSCPATVVLSNQPLTFAFANYTVNLPKSGIIRARFANDGTTGSQTMQIDYAIIDGVKYEAESMPINTAVWSGVCGGSYSQLMHCPGYIQFPSGTTTVTICARAVDGGAEKLSIQVVPTCTISSSSNTLGLPQERASLKWLKYQYFGGVLASPIVAKFTYTTNVLAVAFNGGSSTDSSGTITAYSWNFGDLTTGSGVTVSHTYANSGTYTVTLTVTDNNGKSGKTSQIITVTKPNVAPTAKFVISSKNNLVVQLDATTSTDSDGTISQYNWKFGDGTTGSGKTITHTFSTKGTYTIILTVTDNAGATNSVSIATTLTAPNSLPTASFSWSANQLSVTFDASSSSDLDGTIVSYLWDLGNGATNINKQFVYTYSVAKTYTVKLTVTDNNGGQNIISKTVVVSSTNVNANPIANFSILSKNGLTVTLDGSTSKDPDGSITKFVWSFGDGKSQSGSGLTQVVKTYSASGTYTISLTVTDNKGATGSTLLPVTVSSSTNTNNKPPINVFGYSPDQPTDLIAYCWFGGYDSDGTITGYLWNFGDGKTSTQMNPAHTFPKAGTYTITLTVTDNLGASTTAKKSIAVLNNPVSVHVQSMNNYTLVSGSDRKAVCEIKIYYNNGVPAAAGITVQAYFTNNVNMWQTVRAITNTNGLAVLTTKAYPALNLFSVCFNSLTPPSPLYYYPNDNKVQCK